VDPDESAEDAAVREAKEETGLNITDLRQFRVYSSPGRDPRFHTIATVFTASAQGSPVPGDDAAQSCVFQPNKLPEKMAFDHLQIISDWLAATKEKSENGT
jgi:ADP-ribose pyrophosphatase YjhB (NUDIX family)